MLIHIRQGIPDTLDNEREESNNLGESQEVWCNDLVVCLLISSHCALLVFVSTHSNLC